MENCLQLIIPKSMYVVCAFGQQVQFTLSPVLLRDVPYLHRLRNRMGMALLSAST